MVVNQWDKYAEIFDRGIGNGEEDLHRNYLDPLIFSYLGQKKYKTIVDAGCGNGYLLNKLAKISTYVVGLDYSDKLLKASKERIKGSKNISLLKADLTQRLPIKDNSTDVVIANMVLQYLPQLESFAKECYRILKPGGLLLILVDHPGHYLYARAQELNGKKDPHFLESGSYFKEGRRKKKSLWNKAILEYYHRTVSGYINPFNFLFKLVKVDENTQDKETPRILAMKFVKK